ncbi:LD44138p [Strongyloides ratti]|uniref:LD44138p n=1 Tax=Strongyloides ratti TaxID=34506 RepID=A0A090LCK2_STRRB|nr:LD44138p [Strongyloides ratti]CEF65848.1 LD44138p [Strongyloides ratti]
MLPPPPIAPKPKNDRGSAISPGFRNRPVSNSFNNAKMLFNNLSQPQTRTTLTNAIKSPIVQKAVIPSVQNSQVRESVTMTSNNTTTSINGGEKVAKDDKFKQQLADIIKHFDKSPAIISSNTKNSLKSSLKSTNVTANNYNHSITPEPLDPFNYTNINNINSNIFSQNQNTNNSMLTKKDTTSLTIDDILFGEVGQNKKIAPNRPPPPKKKNDLGTSLSYSSDLDCYDQQHQNLYYQEQHNDYHTTLQEEFNPYCPSKKYGPGLAALEKNLRNSPDIHLTEPYAIAIYPYKPNHFDEIPCEVNDIIILIKEIDEYWVEGKNYRTGVTGIIPLNYLQIKLPLAPVTTSESPYYSSGYGSSSSLSPKNFDTSGKSGDNNKTSNNVILCTAIYDYDSGIEGDLKFSAGDIIVIHERLNDDWLRGQLGKVIGIFPISYVNIQNLDSIPFCSGKVIVPSNDGNNYVKALYEYNSLIEGDLTFSSGDLIKIIEKISDDWIRGELNGIVGLVPMTYVEKV